MAFLIAAILIYGFGILTYLFFVHYTVEEQLNFVVVHLASSLIVFLLWLLDRRYRSVFKENNDLKDKLAELEGYKNPTSILSYTHFVSHVNYIMAATKRRGVKNHLLRIEIVDGTPNTTSVEHVLLTSAVHTFMVNFFDLITQRIPGELLVFLQDTDNAGAMAAIKRLKADLADKIALADLPFTFRLHEVDDNDFMKLMGDNFE